VDALEGTYANSITLSSGDNYIPGPFLAAGTDSAVRTALREYYEQLFNLAPGALSGLREGAARIDIAILNAIGVQASALGNHELDLGTNVVANAIDFIAGSGSGTGRISSIGALFPYLSANLDFSDDGALRSLVTQTLREASSYTTTAADLANDAVIGAKRRMRRSRPGPPSSRMARPSASSARPRRSCAASPPPAASRSSATT
jgi:2',3'-cyclic-nucleotide 2'-phosphodiesterase (5'-nucleotidase family)